MVLLEEVDPAEVLLLVGSCNNWNPSSAARSHVFVQKPGPVSPEVQHEIWVRMGDSGEEEFQIISRKHKWEWRIYPDGALKTLACSKPKAVTVNLGRGHGAKDAHNRNFLVKADKGSLVVVKVRLGQKLKVWYDLPPESAAMPSAPVPEGALGPQEVGEPGQGEAAGPEAFGRHERLRLVGPFCSWRLDAAGLVFQRRFSSESSTWQEHRLYLQLHADPIEFQVVSDQLGFQWRLFPKYEEQCKLPRGSAFTTTAPEVVVGGASDGHHLNFIIDDEPLSVVAISVWLQVSPEHVDSSGKEGEAMEAMMRSREHIRARVTYEPVGCSLQEAMQIALGCSPAAAGAARSAERDPAPRKDAQDSHPSEGGPDPDDPMEDLAREDVWTPDFWTGICPWLHVEDKAWQRQALAAAFPLSEGGVHSTAKAEQLKRQLETEGYFTIDKEELPWAVDVAAVARGVTEIVKLGLPAACILLFDEPWVMAEQLRPLIFDATGGDEPIFDWAAFCVKAAHSKSGFAPAGWPPHRDRMSDRSAVNGFRADGSPKYVTCWIALTEASLESSCLMVVPKTHDPGYAQGDARNSPLDTVFARPERFQHIRPLPTPAGGVVAFSHRLLHWGSAATARAPEPRVAIAFGVAAADYERPYLSRSLLPMPNLEIRLSLMAGQVITYSDNEQVITSARRLRILFDLFEEHQKEFTPDYRNTVNRFNSFKHEQFHGAGLFRAR